jgi:tRNA (guanosine-2'-O-)-methyltransferase
MTKDLVKYLSDFVTPERFSNFSKIAMERTRYITVLLENIYQPHNASAVLRTCDCFGIQDVHIIENEYEYVINPDITLGSTNWLNLYKYNKEISNTEEALITLKKKGYRLIATTPHTKDVELESFDISRGKFALLFGTELTGLSDQALNMADGFIKVPMYGFTESLNISVSAAIILHRLTSKLRQSNLSYHLTEAEQDEVVLEWLKLSIKRSELIVERYYKTRS